MIFTQSLFILFSLGVSVGVNAEKVVFYADENITIYTDNTMVQTGKKTSPVFKPSSTWVEEDFFTQQEKYCEVDASYAAKMQTRLKQKPSTIKTH